MTPGEIRASIEDIVRTELRTDMPLPDDAVLAEHLDSIRRLSLVVAIEDHFEICFEPEDDEAARTLDDVVRIVTQRVRERRHD
ncbi:MAG: acyl carrier protein [Myxococcota bacterium]|nr:acyl carrier protein [Myxococcota bacterium]MEC8424131.1 acyl carrier protein [Myxococcota bacterium]